MLFRSIFTLGGAAIGGLGAVIGAAGGLLASVRVNELLAFIETVANAARAAAARLSGGAVATRFKVLDPAYYLETIPVDVPYGEIAMVVAATVALSFAAALGPARRAASLSPLDGFRRR